MHTTRSLQESWEQFAKDVFRDLDVSDTQRNEMRRAFFAGAFIAVGDLIEVSLRGQNIKETIVTFYTEAEAELGRFLE